MSNSNSPQILPPKHKAVEGSLAPAERWQQAMKLAIRSGRQLCEALNLKPIELAVQAETDFPVFVPLEFLARIEKGNPDDPLLRQVLATTQELDPGGMPDPVGDLEAVRVSGLLQKYRGRVLLVATGACAIHCRYCFRRNFPYQDSQSGRQAWHEWLKEIRSDTSIREVILSGGDPLTVTDEILGWFAGELDAIPHVKRLRVHSRLPVVIPQRVCDALLDWVSRACTAVYFVLHVNHAREIDSSVTQAIEQLRQSGATLLNQAVLLRDINDSIEAQLDLCNQLIDHQVLPYYLHQLDLARGALHFEVDDQRAGEILEGLRRSLPGYGVPRLVREQPGMPCKTPVL